VEFDAKKSDLNKDGKISKYERKRGEAIARNMRNGGMVELQARGCGAMMNAKRKTTRVPK
jgi:stage V sporulation protein SpoVS